MTLQSLHNFEKFLLLMLFVSAVCVAETPLKRILNMKFPDKGLRCNVWQPWTTYCVLCFDHFSKCSPEQQMLKKYSLLRLRPFWIVWIKISTDTWNKTSRYLFKVLRSIWSNSILWQHPTISIPYFSNHHKVWTRITFLPQAPVLKPIYPLNCSITWKALLNLTNRIFWIIFLIQLISQALVSAFHGFTKRDKHWR